MFVRAYLPAGRMTLGIFEAPDDMGICDLDDANSLLHMGMKPSQVVTRNLPYTQSRAADAFASNAVAAVRWGLVVTATTLAATASLVSVRVTAAAVAAR